MLFGSYAILITSISVSFKWSKSLSVVISGIFKAYAVAAIQMSFLPIVL